jgi:hypothetical protein
MVNQNILSVSIAISIGNEIIFAFLSSFGLNKEDIKEHSSELIDAIVGENLYG